MAYQTNIEREWLEADGSGGFASGTVSGIRTRRYHGLLVTSTTPPTGRIMLVNGFEAWVHTPAGKVSLSSHLYTPGVVHPDGAGRIANFQSEPWPRWTFLLQDGTPVDQEIFVPKGAAVAVVSWRLGAPKSGVSLHVRPFFSGRDYHALHRENAAFNFKPHGLDGRRVWRPYPGVPGILVVSNGAYVHRPEWYRNFLYQQEQARGLDDTEDLASPGMYQWDLSSDAVWILAAEDREDFPFPATMPAEVCLKNLRAMESERRRQFPSPLHRAADQYIVAQKGRGAGSEHVGEKSGKTIIAGYPWFTDWGRDTFIALRGLCLATGKMKEAREILIAWASAISEGMVPNRFPDAGHEPEFNAVDASLWYVIAVYEYLQTMERCGAVPASDRDELHTAIERILAGYAKGTRFGIHLDDDGLLAAGQPRVQLTWMDAKVGDWVVTPRIGKPVEVQALWLNALRVGGAWSSRWGALFLKGHTAFVERFWSDTGGYLYDVVDCDHRRGTVDGSFRPNQIFAIGGLPISLLDGERAKRLVGAVEKRLWTPMGLRSLAPAEPGYAPHYRGGPLERDGAYHQGTVWPWLAGPFVEAWVRVHGGTAAARHQARERYLAPLLTHVNEAGIGHISEIADAEPPHRPGGCPFQAWSVGEILRLSLVVLSDGTTNGQDFLKKREDEERNDGQTRYR